MTIFDSIWAAGPRTATDQGRTWSPLGGHDMNRLMTYPYSENGRRSGLADPLERPWCFLQGPFTGFASVVLTLFLVVLWSLAHSYSLQVPLRAFSEQMGAEGERKDDNTD